MTRCLECVVAAVALGTMAGSVGGETLNEYRVDVIAEISSQSVDLRVPYGLSPDGTVVGTSGAVGSGGSRALRWRDGVTEQLADRSDLLFFSARGVNAGGIVVGSAHNGTTTTRALMWDENGITDIGTLGGRWANASAINDRGLIVGGSATANSNAGHAFLYSKGRMRDLGTLNGGSYTAATAVSNNGHVVGHGNASGISSTAFRWHNTFLQQLRLPDGYGESYAYDVNDFGQTVGVAVSGGSFMGVLWSDDEVRLIGSLGTGTSIARGVNNNGVIVGRSVAADYTSRGFIWMDDVMHDLTDLVADDAWIISTAEQVNDSGMIIGTALRDNVAYAVRLTPVGPYTGFSVRSIPSSGTLALIGVGAMATAMRRRRAEV